MSKPATERDWAAVRASKVERLRLSDELRRHALLLHPDWPTDQQRVADYEAQVRLSERLAHVSPARQR